ncbi:DUF6517 family protein [Halorubrum cibi]|uniref:Uncharacterized protein n=1 Tax=Halorubrum cibi TaxID=413815 RepID=A0A521AF72_9EURY|nr:DUF6517 family protein [Halorubrum cibi]SMO33439.1 hypothetical protein SAMN06264867_101106 [Halorubrum cibi]
MEHDAIASEGTDRDAVDDGTGRDDRGTTRRRALAVAGSLGIAGLAGCTALDVVTGGDPVEFAAEAATVSDAALEETGYESQGVTDDVITREFEVAGQTRQVEVTNRIAEYDRGVDVLGQRFRGAVFAALSTPKVEVLGRTFNPVAEMDTDELATMLQDRYEGMSDVERVSEYATDVVGSETTVVEYEAESEVADAGVTVDLTLHVTEPIEVGEDFVVCLGGYPTAISDGDNVRRLLNGVEHPGE